MHTSIYFFRRAIDSEGFTKLVFKFPIAYKVDSKETLQEIREDFDAEGKRLHEVLKKTLPGGTMDALLREMLNHKASLLVVKS